MICFIFTVSSADLADSLVRFDRHGDGLPRYTLYNYQQNSRATGWDYKVDSLL